MREPSRHPARFPSASTLLICGAGTLFAACGATAEQAVAAGGDASGSADVATTGGDASGGPSADVGTDPESDVGAEPEADTSEAVDGGEPGDVSEAVDAAPDVNEPADVPALPDVPEAADTHGADDVWTPEDVAVDVGVFDDVLLPDDAGEAPDLGGPPDVAGPEDPVEGTPCDAAGQSWCDKSATMVLDCVWVDTQGIWKAHQDTGGLPCFCDPQTSPGYAVCAVPGFVGIDVAGRHRQGPSLRALRRMQRAA